MNNGRTSASERRRLIRRRAVQERCGLSNSAMYEQIAKGEFPRPVSIGARAVAWVEEEIDAWIDQRIVDSRGAQHPTGDRNGG